MKVETGWLSPPRPPPAPTPPQNAGVNPSIKASGVETFASVLKSERGPRKRTAVFPGGAEGSQGKISPGVMGQKHSWVTTSLLWVLHPQAEKSGMDRGSVGGGAETKVEKKGFPFSSTDLQHILGL